MDPIMIGEMLAALMFFGVIGFLLLGFPVAFLASLKELPPTHPPARRSRRRLAPPSAQPLGHRLDLGAADVHHPVGALVSHQYELPRTLRRPHLAGMPRAHRPASI